MTPMAELADEMLWHDYAPSSVAEGILRKWHRPTVLPAPANASLDLLRFEYHLKANGVGDYFSVHEIVAPNHPDKASSVGYMHLTPPAHTWGVACLLVWIADQMRSVADSPVVLRNYWRPQSYNKLVASSGIESDHPNACGIDLDFQNESARRDALDWLCTWLRQSGNAARASVGIGAKTLHVGVLSPNGSRYWTYDSFNESDVPSEISEMAHWPSFRLRF